MDYIQKRYINTNLSELNKLTLVIPTYNRCYYLSRNLWYHAHFPFRRIIVADSSDKEILKINSDTIDKIRETFDIEVLHLKYEQNPDVYGKDYFRKWGDAASYADTPYCHYCADKDFLYPETLVDNINFLELNQEYEVSSGSYKVIMKYDSELRMAIVDPAYTDHESRTEENAIQRLIMSFTPRYRMLIYATFRTRQLVNIYEYNINYNISDVRYGEILYTAISSLYGKFNYNEHLPECIRDISMRQKTGDKKESSSMRLLDIPDYDKNTYSQSFSKYFISCVANAITDVSGTPYQEAENLAETEIHARILGAYNPKSKPQIWNTIMMIVKQINNWLGNIKWIRKLGYNIDNLVWYNNEKGMIVKSTTDSPDGVIIKLIADTISNHPEDRPINM